MKKILYLLSILLIIFVSVFFISCGNQTSTNENQDTQSEVIEMGTNEIADLYEKGFICTSNVSDEKAWKGIFQKEDSYDEVYLVKAEMNKELYEKYDSISFDDEQQEDKQKAIITSLKNVEIKDITKDVVPSKEELNSYKGKTIAELEKDGFENSGNSDKTFYYDGPKYSVEISFDKEIKDINDYSSKDLKKLKISNIEFTGISDNILE